MIQKIKTTLMIAVATLLTLGAPVMAFGGAASASGTGCADSVHNINAGVNAALGSTGANGSGCQIPSNTSGSSIASIAKTAVNLLSLIVGIVAVIMIIYGGLRYITSGGDSNSVGGAKNTLIYAIIGLVIVALAQLIVHFVLNAALNGSTATT